MGGAMAINLLVVDDSATIQKVIKIAFSRHQVQVIAVNTVVEAVAALRRDPADVLIIDAGLPGISQASDFQRVTRECPEAKMLMLLGSYESIDEQELIAAGFDQFLRKPFESSDIIAKVKVMLGRDLDLRQTASPQTNPFEQALPSVAQIPPPPPLQTNVPPPPSAECEGEFRSEPTQTKPNNFARSEETKSNVNLAPPRAAEAMSTTDLPPLPFNEPTNITPPPPPPPRREAALEGFEKWKTQEVSSAASPPQDRLATGIEPPPPPPLTDEARKGRPAFSLSDLEQPKAKSEQHRNEQLSRDSVFTESGELVGEPPSVAPPPQATGGEANLPPVPSHTSRATPNVDGSALDEFKPNIREVRSEIERFVRQELHQLVSKLLNEYCAEHFDQLAREVIQAELRRLADEKARHLVDG